MPAAVASRYARALADVVLAPASPVQPGRIVEDLRSFEQTLAGAPELTNALESPAVKRAKKRAIIGRIGESLGLSNIGRNFLLVLADHRRINDLSEAIAAFERIVDERLGRLQVDVASATQLAGAQQAALIQRLEGATGKKVSLNVKVDDSLVGGMIVRLGSTVYDGSVRGRLDSLARQLQAE